MQLLVLDRAEAVVDPAPSPALRLVTEPSRPARRAGTVTTARRPSRRDPRPVAENFARGVAEALVRARSVDQLRDLATFEVIRVIERAAGRDHSCHGQRPVQPRLRSVHLGSPGTGIIEACAVVDGGVRTRAFAFRLEFARERWRCTVLQLG